MTWLSEHNRNAPIYLLVNGRRLNINQDIEDIISYFRNKEPDLFVLPHQHIGARAAPVCALDLKQNTYKLRSSDPKVELPADLSWSENPFNDRNWEFKLHGWSFVDCLMQGYEATGDAWFLDRVKWVVEDWWDDNFVTDPPSKGFSWYDHTIPLRVGKLIQIWEFVRRHHGLDADFVKAVLRLAYWQARMLDEEPSVRVQNHNHGLDQADYLMRTAFVFPEFELSSHWQRNARQWMQDEIEFMMSSEGIQTENSPGYHFTYGASVFRRLQWVEHYTGEALTPKLSSLENAALKFATVISQPDGYLPQLGDTGAAHRFRINLPHLEQLSWYPHYAYLFSKGETGSPPDELRFIFPESGYYIYRDRWDTPRENQSTQLILKCGYLAQGHRQDDDGQIMLYGLGEPWLTDGGQYGYVRNKIREYMRSHLAHNISYPEGVKARRNLNERLTKYADTWGMSTKDPSQLDSVSCSSHMYTGYQYNRQLEVLGPQKFSLTDQLLANSPQRDRAFITQFRVPQDKVVIINEEQGIVAVKGQSGNQLFIRYEKNDIERVTVFSGQSGDDMSVDTVGWRKVTPVKTIRFYWTGQARLSSANFELELVSGK